MDLFKHTLYINLDSRTDRLEHVTNELKKMDINAERVKAVKLENGGEANLLLAPYQFRSTPLRFDSGVPELGEMGRKEKAGQEIPQ